MLVVTFTNAAASEMRERILDAIYEKIEKNPKDIHLQKQITLLNKSSICTIHSFCLDVIRNYFYETDISANFKIGDSSEIELLKVETLEDLFEEKYIEKDEDFLKLIDTYANYRQDESLKELILKIYNQIQSNPFPKDWLEEKVEMFNLKDKLDEDFSNTIWGNLILKELQEEIKENRLKLDKVYKNLKKYPELEKYANVIFNDKEELEKIENIINQKNDNKNNNIWDKVYSSVQDFDFKKWPIDRKVTIDYKNEAKDIRDKIRKSINTICEKVMIYSSKEANEIIFETYEILTSLKKIVLEFEELFTYKKKEKNIIDFHDIEHYALKILTTKDEEGKIVYSKVAKELQEKFEEIAIDEYQDSNLVQEYILNSVSKQNNIFMVGDIKQSIYRFREARPELFLEKYKNYMSIDKEQEDEKISIPQKETSLNGKKIKLFKNFRSRKEVLDVCNWIFEEIMSEKLGDVDYNKEEYLNLGADYEEELDRTCELHILDLAKEDDDIWKEEVNENEQEEKEEHELLEKNVEEAKMVANRIEELFKQNYMVYDKKRGRRKIEYRDIAILLRSTANTAPIYEKELTSRNIPVFCDTTSEYLDASEIQTILSLLKIIDNPMQDIPLVHVMRSAIGNFTDNELVEIRLSDNKGYFYEALLKKRLASNEELKTKIDNFLNMIENFRKLEKEIPLNELIWKIYADTNYYNYVGLLNNGALKQANLKMLFERAKQYEGASFKGLYNFIHFIERLKSSSSDLSSAKIVGENDNVIRIMSIHKSKGLEFPVVFLCNSSKMFNKQDLTSSILIHQDLGFGPKYIDSEYKIEYQTLAKEAMKLKLLTELISEEMRVLYVALTRPKEKLIITGISKDFNKSLKEKEEMLSLYDVNENSKIEERLLKKYTSYLDWIMLLMIKYPKQEYIKLKVHKLDENNKQEVEENEENKEEILADKEKIEEIKTKLEWEYKHSICSKIPTKTSVSKIKEENSKVIEKTDEIQEISLDEITKEYIEYNLEQPKFINKERENISSSRKGTLVHLCLQKLDSKKEYTKEELEDLISDLVNRKIILEEEAKAIPIIALENYLKSNLWNELKDAKEIHKEEAFYLELAANIVNKDYPEDETILLQGIMDLYFIDKDDNLVLVDYKTDYVEKNEEQKLIDKYKIQLDLYKESLEKSLNRKVQKVMIYSTWIGEIEIK